MHKALSMILAAGVSLSASATVIEVSNPLDFERVGELVEIEGVNPEGFVLVGPDMKEVPYQVSSTGTLLFPATVAAKGKSVYRLIKGNPMPVAQVAYGRWFPERDDDMTWENDKAAYRAYGPKLQKRGERGYGYDIWCKSVDYPVIESRYDNHLHHNKSFHKEWGDGLDVYSVGSTLGGGAAALLNSDGEPLYPWCWKEYEILEKGPLRFSVRLTYQPTEFEGNEIVEERVITLDAGSYLNRTELSYKGLDKGAKVMEGTVIHKANPTVQFGNDDVPFVAYEDLTDNPSAGNGSIFVGIVPTTPSTLTFKEFAEAQGDAIGHGAAITDYTPGKPLVYYWGSGWSKHDVADINDWVRIMGQASQSIAHPLKIKVKK